MTPAPVSGAIPDDLASVQRMLAEVDAELVALGRLGRAAEHREQIRLLSERFELRFESLRQAHDAVDSLRRISSRPELLREAPRAITRETRFRRALVSVIRDGSLIPLAVTVRRDADETDTDTELETAEQMLMQLREQPIQLEHNMVESDVMRRRRAALVANIQENTRVNRRMAALLGSSAYVVAPLLSGSSAIGTIHADRGPTESLDAIDRDVLWEFASVLSQTIENAQLRRELRQERELLRRFIDCASSLSLSLADAPITFSTYAGADTKRALVLPALPPGAGDASRDDRLVFLGLLTRRELDVLRLLVEGGTNRAIADALVLSETTVKFHVSSVLRKLRASNRAEAVARYLSMLGLS